MVDVAGVRLGRRHHRTRGDEPGDVVDMSVCVIPGDAAPEPDECLHTEMVAEHTFHVVSPESRVTGLHDRVQQAFLGRQCGALAVDVDAAPFEHDSTPPTRTRGEPAQAQDAGDPRWQPVVV